uniref:TraB domain-containing protein n=1 Tax=Cajanus cajan TaxID=3821 RepID=A0A151S6A3_CAJCA|nr:TraB domain-containing protein [Cajanus cajan]
MDAPPPEPAAPAASAEDFVHVADLKMESLSESMVRIDEPETSDADGVSSATEASTDSDRRPLTLPEELSRNVVVLSCESAAEGGVCDVYLVGTAHVSEESSREVQAIVNFLKPQVVFLELCSSRVAVLTLQNLKVPTMGEMITMLKKKHNMFEIASKLEVFPGSEFRVAYEEAIKYGGRVILGDRPVQITLRRTWSKMPLWHKTKLLYSLFFQAVFLPSSDDLNKMLKEMDDSDMLTLVIQEMSKEFPTLMETLVHERDQYMSSTLLKVASENSSVVAVVGKGHLQGIKKHWKQPVVMKDLMTVPSPKPAVSAIRILTSVGVAVWGGYSIRHLYFMQEMTFWHPLER